MTAAVTARADQLRASIREALDLPCTCSSCPTDEDLRELLQLDDWQLVQLVDS